MGYLKTILWLLLFYYLFIRSDTPSDPTVKHSMTKTNEFPLEVATSTYGIIYYVNEKFTNQLKKNP